MALAGAVIGIAAVLLFLANSSGDDVKKSFASLQNLQTRVSLQSGGTGDFADAPSDLRVAQGDVVRTDQTGRAELNYFDGSLTRLGANTLFRVVALSERAGARSVMTQLDVGRSWHRVRELTTSGDRFEVRTSNAVAAVRGTVFMVDCISGRCTFTVIEGEVEVTAVDGTKILLRAGERVTVTEDGRMGARETFSLAELRVNDPWVDFNILRDQGAGAGRPSGPSTTSTTQAGSTTTSPAPGDPGSVGPTATTVRNSAPTTRVGAGSVTTATRLAADDPPAEPSGESDALTPQADPDPGVEDAGLTPAPEPVAPASPAETTADGAPRPADEVANNPPESVTTPADLSSATTLPPTVTTTLPSPPPIITFPPPFFTFPAPIITVPPPATTVPATTVPATTVPATTVPPTTVPPTTLPTTTTTIPLGTGDVQVTLTWTGVNDLDLHVSDPSGEEIYFSNPTSASGGTLDQDDIPGCGSDPAASHVENVFWPVGQAPDGTYQARVVNFASCGQAVAFRLTIRINGQIVHDATDVLPATDGAESTPVVFTKGSPTSTTTTTTTPP